MPYIYCKIKNVGNLLDAVFRIVSNPIVNVREHYQGKNRANSVGDALEAYVKDIFSDTFDDIEELEIAKKYSDTFAYLGNQNNPPDAILKNGDAIETKKIESLYSALALNSSYPKAKLLITNPMLTKACRECEKWESKEIIYIIGCVTDTKIKYLWMIYGDCFIAEEDIYLRIKDTISKGINEIEGVEFTETKELGKVKKVDPLGITDLRVRGMWHIDNPHKIFKYLGKTDNTADFQLFVLMKNSKFQSFPEDKRRRLNELQKDYYSIEDIQIKDPNNPAILIDSKLIYYKK